MLFIHIINPNNKIQEKIEKKWNRKYKSKQLVSFTYLLNKCLALFKILRSSTNSR